MYWIKPFFIRLLLLSVIVGFTVQPVAVSADEGAEGENSQTEDAKQAGDEDEEPDCD